MRNFLLQSRNNYHCNNLPRLNSSVRLSRNNVGTLQSFFKMFNKSLTNVNNLFLLLGYGDVIPRTNAGMWLVIITGFLGIPITLLSLQTLGELIHSVIIGLCQLVEVKLMKRPVVTKKDSKALLVTFIIMLMIMIFGALCENYQHNWSWTQGNVGFYSIY